MVIIEDSVLTTLARNAALVGEFPFLKAARGASGCNCKPHHADFNTIKSQLASLSVDGRARFKQLSGFAQVRVVYRQGGQIQTVTF